MFIISLGVLSAILYFGAKFLSGPGDLGHTMSDADGLSPYTSLVSPVSGLYCHSYSMQKYSGSSTVSWDTSLYILKNLPTLSTRYNFSIHPEAWADPGVVHRVPVNPPPPPPYTPLTHSPYGLPSFV